MIVGTISCLYILSRERRFLLFHHFGMKYSIIIEVDVLLSSGRYDLSKASG
jgi:hypothetical protein